MSVRGKLSQIKVQSYFGPLQLQSWNMWLTDNNNAAVSSSPTADNPCPTDMNWTLQSTSNEIAACLPQHTVLNITLATPTLPYHMNNLNTSDLSFLWYFYMWLIIIVHVTQYNDIDREFFHYFSNLAGFSVPEYLADTREAQSRWVCPGRKVLHFFLIFLLLLQVIHGSNHILLPFQQGQLHLHPQRSTPTSRWHRENDQSGI